MQDGGIHINSVAKDREYCRQYTCEAISKNPKNKMLIGSFHAPSIGKGLESYLKECAWQEDLSGETRVYLVKDSNDGVALYFSLKCGLVYEPYEYEHLEQEEAEFVDLLVDAKKTKDEQSLQDYLQSGYYDEDKAERLYKMALERISIEEENKRLGDSGITLKVRKCHAAIELSHFCKNSNYQEKTETVPLGFGLFWEVIVSKICEVADLIGCKYIYLFAADNTQGADETESEENKTNTQKLIQYYKNELKFEDVQGLKVIKPQYDENCWGMIQSLSDLKKNRLAIWEEFSDIWSLRD